MTNRLRPEFPSSQTRIERAVSSRSGPELARPFFFLFVETAFGHASDFFPSGSQIHFPRDRSASIAPSAPFCGRTNC